MFKLIDRHLIKALCLTALGGIAGCTYPPAHPTLSDDSLLFGPITKGIEREIVRGRCESSGPFMHGSCDLIFTDARGHFVDGWKLAKRLDTVAKQTDLLSPWQSRSVSESSELPYDLHLLTISPAVVLAVPAGRDTLRCGSVYAQGCIQSQGFRGRAYWYRTEPPVRAESFWFVEGVPQQTPLHVVDGKAKIQAEGVEIDLESVNGKWTVRRSH